MKKNASYITILFLLFMLTGCNWYSDRYTPENIPQKVAPYPFALNLQKITYITVDSDGKSHVNNDQYINEQIEKERLELIKKYPQFFTYDGKKSPSCEIVFTKSNPEITNTAGHIITGTLGLLTLGLVPYVCDTKFYWSVEIKAADYKAVSKIHVNQRAAIPNGILGMLIPFWMLVSPVEGYHDIYDKIYRPNLSSEYFQKCILYALMKLDRDKLIAYYNSHYAENENLME